MVADCWFDSLIFEFAGSVAKAQAKVETRFRDDDVGILDELLAAADSLRTGVALGQVAAMSVRRPNASRDDSAPRGQVLG